MSISCRSWFGCRLSHSPGQFVDLESDLVGQLVGALLAVGLGVHADNILSARGPGIDPFINAQLRNFKHFLRVQNDPASYSSTKLRIT